MLLVDQEPGGKHWKKSEKFPAGILFPQNHRNSPEPAVSGPDCSTWVGILLCLTCCLTSYFTCSCREYNWFRVYLKQVLFIYSHPYSRIFYIEKIEERNEDFIHLSRLVSTFGHIYSQLFSLSLFVIHLHMYHTTVSLCLTPRKFYFSMTKKLEGEKIWPHSIPSRAFYAASKQVIWAIFITITWSNRIFILSSLKKRKPRNIHKYKT